MSTKLELKEARKCIGWIEETYIEEPTVENGHSLQSMHLHIRELIGLTKGLIDAVEAAVDARPAVTIINGEKR